MPSAAEGDGEPSGTYQEQLNAGTQAAVGVKPCQT